jgi:hypothetical protein
MRGIYSRLKIFHDGSPHGAAHTGSAEEEILSQIGLSKARGRRLLEEEEGKQKETGKGL